MLLRKDPSQRLSIEQLLQHPWICGEAADARSATGVGGKGAKGGGGRGGGGYGGKGGKAEAAEARLRDEKMRTFRAHTSKLRAACFAYGLAHRPHAPPRRLAPRASIVKPDARVADAAASLA